MADNVVGQILKEHLADGELKPGSPISLTMDQALLQDATGTMALMQFEELGIPRIRLERAVQYVDHNVVQLDHKNPDDHRMLQALARKHLGVKAVIAKSFARIHRRNLVAQGIVALTFSDESDYDKAEVGQCWTLPNIRAELEDGADTITATIEDEGAELPLSHDFSEHEREIPLAGGLLSYLREQNGAST